MMPISSFYKVRVGFLLIRREEERLISCSLINAVVAFRPDLGLINLGWKYI